MSEANLGCAVEAHLKVMCCFLYGTHAVALVLLGGVTHAAQQLLVIVAEEFERLSVGGTQVQLPGGGAGRRGRRVQSLLLLHQRLTHVLQHQADSGLGKRAPLPADGTLALGRLLAPELVQAGAAEAVATAQDHRVGEDLAAHGTRQLVLHG